LQLNRSAKKNVFIKDPHGTDSFQISPYKAPALNAIKGFGGGAAPLPNDGTPFAELVAWVHRQGGLARGVAVTEVAPGLRGAVATQSFAKGALVFSVPHALILDEGTAELSPVAAVWKTRKALEANLPVPAKCKVALLLLYKSMAATAAAATVGSSSVGGGSGSVEWAEALAMLPTPASFEAEGGPMLLWADADVAGVHCPKLVADVRAQQAQLRAVYDQVRQCARTRARERERESGGAGLVSRLVASIAAREGIASVPSTRATRTQAPQPFSFEKRCGPNQVVAPGWREACGRPGSALAALGAPPGGEPPPYAAFAHAVACVASRAYGGSAAQGQGHLLVPVVDQCNHAHPALANTAKAMAP
jgi:hypothetical protein